MVLQPEEATPSAKDGSRTDTGLGCSGFSLVLSGELEKIKSDEVVGSTDVTELCCSLLSMMVSGELGNISPHSLTSSASSTVTFKKYTSNSVLTHR